MKKKTAFVSSPHHCVLRGPDECRGDRDLVLCPGRDVEAGLTHDGHVKVVDKGNLEWS